MEYAHVCVSSLLCGSVSAEGAAGAARMVMMRLMMRADLRRRMANVAECSRWRLMAPLAFGRM